MSSSLPEDVQLAFLRTIRGLEHVEIMRPAYAIEYDCVDPTALRPTLETKQIHGLYGAGQLTALLAMKKLQHRELLPESTLLCRHRTNRR